jgi:hypothetical protein
MTKPFENAVPAPPLRPQDWLLCEALRRFEEGADGVSLDDPATRRAARTDGSLPERIATRARLHPDGKRLAVPIRRALTGLRFGLIALLVLGLLLGAAAARALIRTGGSEPVIQLSWSLLTLIGLPSLMLLIWAAVWLWPRRAASGLPGRAVWWAAAAFARRVDASGHGRAAAAALADYGRHGGRRIASAATHLFWTGYAAGALGLLAAAFIGLRFDFAWGSTLLGPDALAPAVEALGRLAALWPGIEAPDRTAVTALLIDRSPAADRSLWAGVLLALLALLGLLPRALLATLFLWLHRSQRLELDRSRAGFLALARVLQPALAGSTGRIGPAPPEQLARRTRPRAVPGSGATIAIGVELEAPGSDPALLAPDAEWLGTADDRASRRIVLEAVSARRPKPQRAIVLCSMLRTPDRGTGHWLAELDSLVPVAVRLVETPQLIERDGDPASREADWVRLCSDFGLDPPERDD